MLVVGREQIEPVLDLRLMAPAIEEAYRAASAGDVDLPPVGHMTFPEVDGDCHIKYGYRKGDPHFVIKVATGFPHHDATGNGLSLVLSAQTGQVDAVLHDEMLLTDVRTGIGGAIATRLLARPDATRLLIVGTGNQARRQIDSHAALLDRDVEIRMWGRSADAAGQAATDVAATASVELMTDLGDGCRWADMIVTTTASTTPIVMSEWITPGTHITAVGADAPGKHELDEQLVRRADVLVADSRSQCLDHGELSVVADSTQHNQNVIELGELLAGQPGRRGDDDITVADLTGIAAQDIAAATFVLDALG